MPEFKIVSDFKMTGDQPQAVAKLAEGLAKGFKAQTLLGVTGSGKTFTMANVIEKVQRPTLVICHNKTLAAQLASELLYQPELVIGRESFHLTQYFLIRFHRHSIPLQLIAPS